VRARQTSFHKKLIRKTYGDGFPTLRLFVAYSISLQFGQVAAQDQSDDPKARVIAQILSSFLGFCGGAVRRACALVQRFQLPVVE
jgi:hypothetical protein